MKYQKLKFARNAKGRELRTAWKAAEKARRKAWRKARRLGRSRQSFEVRVREAKQRLIAEGLLRSALSKMPAGWQPWMG
jgi:hypothetical protein